MTKPEPRYPFLHVTLDAEQAESISEELFALGAQGIEERDDITLDKGPGLGRLLLVASFPSLEEAEEARTELCAARPGLSAEVEEVDGDDWRDAYKAHFAPFALTDRIAIAPPWAEAPKELSEGRHVLVLEPGRAFGTGLHPTTSLVARLLDAHADRLQDRRLLDAGTGSGILALAALRLGARSAVAFDIDADVIDLVRENAERNGLDDRIEVFAGEIDRAQGTFDWVLANIEARVLDPMAEALTRAIAPGGMLVLSGLLAPEHERIARRYEAARPGLRLAETCEAPSSSSEGGVDRWVALRFELRPETATA